MELTGKNFIGRTMSAEVDHTFHGRNPRTNEELSPAFAQSTPAEIDRAAQLAAAAAPQLRQRTAEDIAGFLDRVAEELGRVKDDLIERAAAESGLPTQRLTGEHGRTAGQIRMFAALVREGSWVDARIDTALPDRQPVPRPDLRRMLMPIGPVAVFGAS